MQTIEKLNLNLMNLRSFFKHRVSDIPKSKINAFRIDFDSFDDPSKDYKVLCTFVSHSASDLSKLNYTSASIITSEKTTSDNIKYCYATNIGSAILPLKENCYRASLDNNYTLKILNPLVMFRDYVFDTNLIFYVSFKPVTDEQMIVKAELTTYDTDERNLENIGHSIILDYSGKRCSILTFPAGKQVQISIVKQCKDSL